MPEKKLRYLMRTNEHECGVLIGDTVEDAISCIREELEVQASESTSYKTQEDGAFSIFLTVETVLMTDEEVENVRDL